MRHHQKSETGVSVATKMDMCPPKKVLNKSVSDSEITFGMPLWKQKKSNIGFV